MTLYESTEQKWNIYMTKKNIKLLDSIPPLSFPS